MRGFLVLSAIVLASIGGGIGIEAAAGAALYGSGWTGYAPPTRRAGSIQAFALTDRGPPPRRRHLALRPAMVQGGRVEVGVACSAPTSCIAALFGLNRLVDGHPVQWSATAFARSRTLVTSLRPVAGAPLAR